MKAEPRIPECDCYTEWKGPNLHRPGCPRLAAIVALYRPNDAPRSGAAKR